MRLGLPVGRQTAALVIAGCVAFTLFVLAAAPAALLAGPLAKAGVVTQGLHGTVWSGEADGVIAGTVRVRTLRWRVEPLGLLRARAQARIDATLPDEGFAAGRVALGPGALRLEDFTAAAPLAVLGAAAAALGPTGQLRLKLEQLDWQDDWITGVVGSAEVTGVDAAFGSVPGGAAIPGSYAVRFDAPSVATGEPLTGELRDTGGPVEFAGTLTLLPPANYSLAGSAKARAGAPPALAQGLTMLGPADAQGGHSIGLEGSF